MINKILYSISLFILILANNVFGDEISTQAAYGDALVFVAIKLLIATIVFCLLSFGLVKKPRDSAINSARWFASILVSFSIIAFPQKYEIEARNFFELGLSALGWCALGLITGYLWFKFKHIRNANVAIMNVETYTNKKLLLPILALVSVGVGGWWIQYSGKAATYDMYPSCKDVSKDCKKSEVSFTFKVDKEKSQVIAIYTEGQSRELKKLDNCIVLDEYNWQCTDNATDVGDNPYKYTMTDSEMTMSDSTYTQILNGKVSTRTYYGLTFVKR